jgi:predicted nuclease with TOPRIM domain
MEQKNNEIQQLKLDITNYKNEIDRLKNEKQKLNEDLNTYINENQRLKNINNELSNRLNNLNNNLNNGMIADKDKILVKEELKIKDNELKDLIPVIFQTMDQKITYAIICKSTDKFKTIEEILYEKFPEFEEDENYFTYFTIKGKKVKKKETMAQNNINYSDIVIINKKEI